jgi:hypothetical protein
VKRLALGILLAVVAAGAVYWFLLRTETVAPRVEVPRLAARIGSGSEAVGVTDSGAVVHWMVLPEEPPLPALPLSEAPKSGHLAGTALQQARVLGAVPAPLRPYVESSYYGESGVDVKLTTGVELRFGDASQARRKWRAAATVLADPSLTALDYVDLHAPGHPSIGGSGHELPSAP